MDYLKRHRTIIVFYILYVAFTINYVSNLTKNPGPDSGLPIFMLTLVFFIVTVLNALFRKIDNAFYWLLTILIALQVCVILPIVAK
jgi:hypothetical protein